MSASRRHRWHAASVFGPGPRAPMCREQRAQFRAKLLLQRRPGRLTIATASIGRIMVDMLGVEGRLDPSIATLAEKARVSISTTKRALAQLRDCGFLTWVQRRISDAVTGWRVEQTTSAYRLSVPATEVHFGHAVLKKVLTKIEEPRQLSDREARINAARQLVALGAAVPVAWGISADDIV